MDKSQEAAAELVALRKSRRSSQGCSCVCFRADKLNVARLRGELGKRRELTLVSIDTRKCWESWFVGILPLSVRMVISEVPHWEYFPPCFDSVSCLVDGISNRSHPHPCLRGLKASGSKKDLTKMLQDAMRQENEEQGGEGHRVCRSDDCQCVRDGEFLILFTPLSTDTTEAAAIDRVEPISMVFSGTAECPSNFSPLMLSRCRVSCRPVQLL